MILRLTLIALILAFASPASAGRCHTREQCQAHGWTWYGSHSKAKRKEVMRNESRATPAREHVTRPRKEVMPNRASTYDTQPRPEISVARAPGGAGVTQPIESSPEVNTAVAMRFAGAEAFRPIPIPRAEERTPPDHSRAVDVVILAGLLGVAIVAVGVKCLDGLKGTPPVSFPFDASYLTRRWDKPCHRTIVERREAWEFDLPWLPWRLSPEWAIMGRIVSGRAMPLVEFEPQAA